MQVSPTTRTLTIPTPTAHPIGMDDVDDSRFDNNRLIINMSDIGTTNDLECSRASNHTIYKV